MSKSKNLFEKVIWFVYVFYLFSIVAFGERAEYNNYSNITFIILVCLMLIRIISNKNYSVPISLFCFVPFVFFAFLSSLWSYDQSSTIDRSITLLRLLILCFIVTWYLLITDELINYIYGFALAGLIVNVYTVGYYGFDKLSNLLQNEVRLGTEIVNSNTLAVFLSISAIIFFALFIKKKKKYYLIVIAGLVLIAALTGSKKGILDLLVGSLLSIVLIIADNEMQRRGRLVKILIGILVLVFVLYILWQLPFFTTIRNRIELMFSFMGGISYRIDYSTRQRQLMIDAGLKQFIKTPFVGIGINASGYITKHVVGFNTYLHNNYVELLATGGVIGTFCYYTPVIFVLVKNWKYRKQSFENTIIFIMLIITLVNDVAAVQYFSKTTYIVFSFAIAGVFRRRIKEQ